MAEGRRRPPTLSESALGLQADTKFHARSKARDRVSTDIDSCFERLNGEVESLVQRFCEELKRNADQWSVSEDASHSASSEARTGMIQSLAPHAALTLEATGALPATPKLPPPPSTTSHLVDVTPRALGHRGLMAPHALDTTPPQSTTGEGGKLRLVAEGLDDGCGFPSPTKGRRPDGFSPISCSSTRSRSKGLSWDATGEDLGLLELQHIPRPPTAAWSDSGIPLPPETRPSSACSHVDGVCIGRSRGDLKLVVEDLDAGSGDTGGSGSSPTQAPAVYVPGRSVVALEMSGFSRRSSVASLASTERSLSTATPLQRSKTALFSPISRRKAEGMSTAQSRLERLTKSQCYEITSAMLIVLNALFVAWETKTRSELALLVGRDDDRYLEESAQNDFYFGIAANLFCLIFVTDIVLRMGAERGQFCYSREKGWNIFDVFVSVTAVLEALASWATFAPEDHSSPKGYRMFLRKFSMLRILRLLRVIRMTRVVGIIRFIKELRLMVFSLTGSLKSLAWAVVLLLIVLLVFGVFFTDGAIAFCVEQEAMYTDDTNDLRKYFGQLTVTMVSLYMAMSGGEDWSLIFHTLEPLPVEYTLLFLGFVTFAILALLNVITAVFVGVAMQRSQNDRELIVQQEMQRKKELITIMTQVFGELDSNDSGELCLEEFEKHMNDDKIMAYLRHLEIDASQVRTLFRLLDVDQTGFVDIDEFVTGVMRLKGGATSMDLAVLKYQTECVLHNVLCLSKHFGADDRPGSADSRRGGFRNTL